MQAGAGSEEGAAESLPLQKSFGSLVAKNIIILILFKKIKQNPPLQNCPLESTIVLGIVLTFGQNVSIIYNTKVSASMDN